MAQLFDLAKRLDARLVLSGDRRQHGSVERGAALLLLEEEAGLAPAEITEIQRQEKAEYKRAVKALSEGDVRTGFKELSRLGWIREVPTAERYQVLAHDYVQSVERGKTALVIAPTHREGEWVTAEIRSGLEQAGRLRGEEHTVPKLTNANLTEAERADAVNYSPGDVLAFHQNAKGYTKGDRVVAGDTPLPLDQAARFQVFRQGELTVRPGEVLRVTRNGSTADGKHRLNNGALVTVRGFDKAGNLVLTNGWTVSREFGHLDYGYVVTSYASQGKTVQRVLIAQGAESLPAASREQFYVSVSRGREQATIYTDDKVELLEAVSRSDERITATDLVGQREVARRERTRQQSAEPVAPMSASRDAEKQEPSLVR